MHKWYKKDFSWLRYPCRFWVQQIRDKNTEMSGWIWIEILGIYRREIPVVSCISQMEAMWKLFKQSPLQSETHKRVSSVTVSVKAHEWVKQQRTLGSRDSAIFSGFAVIWRRYLYVEMVVLYRQSSGLGIIVGDFFGCINWLLLLIIMEILICIQKRRQMVLDFIWRMKLGDFICQY